MDRKDIKLQAKGLLKDNWGILLLALLLESIIAGVAGLFSLGAASLIIAGPLAIGVLYIYNTVIHGEKGDWKDIIKGFQLNFGDAVLADILISIIVIVPALISFFTTITRLVRLLTMGAYYNSYSSYGYGYDYGASTGTSAMGVIWSLIGLAISIAAIYLLLSYAMTMYILMREPKNGAVYSMKRSRLMMNGYKGKYILFILSFIGWFLLACLTFGILFIWVGPYYKMAETLFFQSIYEEKKGIDMNNDPLKDKVNQAEAKMHDVQNQAATKAQQFGAKQERQETPQAPQQAAAPQSTIMNPQVNPAPQQPQAPVAPQQTQVNATEVPQVRAKLCRNCGSRIPIEAPVCGRCGASQNN